MTIPQRPTELLYLDDSYATTFEATVVGLSETSVALDRTLFYPRGGGQMADKGVLDGPKGSAQVLATENRDGLVWHVVDNISFEPGDLVRGTIDWKFRYRQMRTHTALHVLCGLIFRRFRATVTGCQMYEDRARMDFALDELSRDRVEQIQTMSNEAVEAGHAVRSRWISRAEAGRIPDLIRTPVNLLPAEMDPIRVVEIVDLDLQADGGTQVPNTFEVGEITILKTENKGAANKRIEIAIPDMD